MGCRNSEDSSRSYFSFVRWVEVEPFLSMLFLGVKIMNREVDSKNGTISNAFDLGSIPSAGL